MYPVLSRLFIFCCSPLSWALLAGLGALLLLDRRPRAARALLLLAGLVLTASSLDAVADGLAGALERDAPRHYDPRPPYDVVVILGGAVDAAAARASGELELDQAAERLTRGFEVWREGGAGNVLVSGGLVFPQPGETPEADLLAAALIRWGVPREHVFAEPASRSTRENAVETARVVAAQGWRRILLVTSAAHMQRALGCFQKVGLSPDPLPTDHRAGDGRGQVWLPHAAALARSTDAMRELSGRLVYRVLGYTAP
jgi:uncharacterized SAM-binding protein YcdF (DUF218 family)